MYAHTYRGFLQRKSGAEAKRAWICNRAYALGETEEKRGWTGRDGKRGETLGKAGGETLAKAGGEDVRRSREETSGSNGASSLCGITPEAQNTLDSPE